MLTYHGAHKYKYRLEAFLLVSSITALLPPRLREQVKWGRFINLSGGAGANLDGDEVMEHLNRLAKDRIKMLGPNHTPEVVNRIGKTIMFTRDVTKQLGLQTGVPLMSRSHTAQNLDADVNMVVSELKRSNVFQRHMGRQHATFGRTHSNIYSDINVQDLHKWLSTKKVEYSRGKWAF